MKVSRYFFLVLGILGVSAIGFCLYVVVGGQDEAPKLRLEFVSEPDKNREVRAFFLRFAHEEGFSFEDAGARMPPKNGRPIFLLALRKTEKIEIIVTGLSETKFFVALYEHSPSPDFEKISSQIATRLKQRWANTHLYMGP